MSLELRLKLIQAFHYTNNFHSNRWLLRHLSVNCCSLLSTSGYRLLMCCPLSHDFGQLHQHTAIFIFIQPDTFCFLLVHTPFNALFEQSSCLTVLVFLCTLRLLFYTSSESSSHLSVLIRGFLHLCLSSQFFSVLCECI